MAKSQNPHVDQTRKAFKNWDQAQHHAQQLLQNNEITKADYNKIKSQTETADRKKD